MPLGSPWCLIMNSVLPGSAFIISGGLDSDLHTEWPRVSLLGGGGWLWCRHFAETLVNIYGSKKVKIDNAVSQVEVPLAKSQASFLGQGK